MERPLRVIAWPAEANATGNPYNATLTAALRELGVEVTEFSAARLALGGYDLFHAHWPDGALTRGGTLRAAAGAGALLTLTVLARARGARVIWTVHNLRSHAPVAPALERAFWRGWTRLVDGTIHLGESARRSAFDAFPSLARRPSFVVPHPHYRAAYAPVPERADARAAIGLPTGGRVVVYFGRIRAYKAVPALVRAFRTLIDADARLVVAGEPESDALDREVRDAAAGDDRVVLRLQHVADRDVPAIVGAADLVALPYTELLNSGAALLALSMGRPVFVPEAGAMSDLRDAVGPRWVHLAPGSVTTESLRAALAIAVAERPAPPAPLDAFSPAEVARGTLAAYRTVASARRG